MKNLILGLLVITTSAAEACPNLSSKYRCQHASGERESVAISQTTTGSLTTYKIGGDSYHADGIPREINEDELKGTLTVLCKGNSLHLNLQAKSATNEMYMSVDTLIYRSRRGLKFEYKTEERQGSESRKYGKIISCKKIALK